MKYKLNDYVKYNNKIYKIKARKEFAYNETDVAVTYTIMSFDKNVLFEIPEADLCKVSNYKVVNYIGAHNQFKSIIGTYATCEIDKDLMMIFMGVKPYRSVKYARFEEYDINYDIINKLYKIYTNIGVFYLKEEI